MRAKAATAIQVYRSTFGLDFGVFAPNSRTVSENALLAFDVTTANPDGGPLTLDATGLPLGATFTDHGDGTGEFRWTPGFDQAGAYSVNFTAERADGQTTSA